ncbi:MAG: hypothetical protein K5850_01910 [Bacteroidales bacterium]|nr:hypothetical protein [Bacteroidales bacterium]
MESGLIKLNPQLMSILHNNNGGQNIIPFNYNHTQLGWVPMKDNLVIARLMDAGKLFNCKVVSITKTGPSSPRINVSIYMVD